MNSDELKTFLTSLRDTDIEEMRFEAGKNTIFFRKSETPHVVTRPAALEEPADSDKGYVQFKSPMVGTFYHSESSDHPPFVIEGNHIVPGQKIGIIEAMKIIKDVSSDVKGRIVKVSVKNGQSVEYGQELFLVDPSDVKETEK